MDMSLSRIARGVAHIPESRRALPVAFVFSAILMGTVYLVRMGADLNYDGEIYISAAYRYALGMSKEGLEVYPMPFYPYLISLMHRVIPDWVLAGKLISYLFMALTIVPLYRLSTDLFNRQAAFWSCLAFTLLPETLLYSNSVLREPGFSLFFVWAIYSAQRALKSKRITDLFKTAFFGFFSTLFRIEGLIIFPIYFCFFIALTVSDRQQSKGYLRMVVAWGCLFLLLAAAGYIGIESHGTVSNRYDDWAVYFHSLKDTSFLENYRYLHEQFQQLQEASPRKGIGQHFVETARNFMPLIYVFGTLQALLSAIQAVNVIPLLWALKKTRYAARHVLVLIVVCCLSALACGFFVRHNFIIKRYLFMPAVLLCPWVGFGIDRILAFVSSRAFKKWIVAGVLLSFLAVPALEFDKYFKNKDDLKSQMGSWIAAHGGLNNLRIVFNDQIVKFYTDLGIDRHGAGNTIAHLDPDDLDFSKLARFALGNNVDGIVISSRVDRIKDIAEFAGYEEIKEFNNKKKSIKFYISKERRNSLENQRK